VLLLAIVGFTVHESGKGVVVVQTGKVARQDLTSMVSASGETGNTIADSDAACDDDRLAPAARISKPVVKQSRSGTAPRMDDAASTPAPEGDEQGENCETSGNQMDSVA